VWYGPDDLRLLTPPGGTSGAALDIADDGTVVGYFYLTSGPRRGFIYDPDSNQYTVLEPGAPGGWCQATGINSKSQVVGDRSLTDDSTLYQAFVWENGAFLNINTLKALRSSAASITETGEITGWTGSAAYNNSFGYEVADGRCNVLPPIPGGYSSVGIAINDRRTIVGGGRESTGPFQFRTRAFTRVNGVMLNLGALPDAKNSIAVAVNEANEIVGSSSVYPKNPSGFRPTLWRGTHMLDLIDFVQISGNVQHVTSAVDITDNGEILLRGGDIYGDNIAVVVRPMTRTSADLDHNCRVDVQDLLHVIATWGPGESWSDITGDGVVNVEDLIMVLWNWGG
jgi:probable HAF family extracellular repeat protein